MNKAIENNNKDSTITQSQCHSSSNKKLLKTNLETILENTTIINTVADSAATGHFFPNKNNDKNKHNIIEVVCANNQTMESVATTTLDIPELSLKAKTAFHFNEMKQPLLLSIPFLADDGCKINLTKDNIVVTKDNKIILKGIRDEVSTLWMIPINRIPVMAPILAPILGVYFWGEHVSLKNGTFCPLFSHDSSSFKDTCFLIK
jgi:hypothetical protein